MKNTFLAALFILINFSFVALLLGAEVDDAIEGIRTPQDITPESMEDIKGAIKDFKGPSQISPKEFSRPLTDGTEQQRAVRVITGEDANIPESKEASAQSCSETGAEAKKYAETVFYFFSFSMPRDSIKKAVEDAISINKACGAGPKVVMVL